MKNTKPILFGVFIVVFLVTVPYAGWKISRWWNYKMSYQDLVQAEIQKAIKPLSDRITMLEFQVKTNR